MAARQTGGNLAQRSWIEGTITRADGTIEYLGVLSDSGLPERRTLLSRALAWFR